MEEQKRPKKKKRKGERPDGLIPVWLDLGRKPNGKRNRKPFYGHTREEAEKKRDEFLEKRDAMTKIDGSKTTVSQWCDMWKTAYKADIHGTNEVSLDANLKRLKNDIGYMLMYDVLNIHIQRSLSKMNGMSKSAITKYKSVLQQVFRRAKQNKVIKDNPAEDLAPPDGEEGEHRAIERWETDCIMNNWQVHRCGLWAMVMLLDGIRRGEMIALDWEKHVNMEARTITVHESAEIISNQAKIKDKTKTAAGMRVLPMCQPLYDALNTVPLENRKGLVCKSAKGKTISQSAFKRGWDGFNLAMERVMNGEPVKQLGRRIDIEKRKSKGLPIPEKYKNWIKFSVRAHDLRYTFATALYDAGVDVKSAQYYLGHSDIRMTMNLYTQLSKEREAHARSQATTFLDSWVAKLPPASIENPPVFVGGNISGNSTAPVQS